MSISSYNESVPYHFIMTVIHPIKLNSNLTILHSHYGKIQFTHSQCELVNISQTLYVII